MILRRVEVGELDIVRVAVVSVAGAASSAHVHSEAATPLVGPYVLGNVLQSDVAVGLRVVSMIPMRAVAFRRDLILSNVHIKGSLCPSINS